MNPRDRSPSSVIAEPPSPAQGEVGGPPSGAAPAPRERGLGRVAQGAAMLVALAVLVALAIAPYTPPGVVPASAPPDVFSAERALPHLQAIAARPHPVGSAENVRVRDYLLQQLAALGLRPEVQRTAILDPASHEAVVVENVLVRLPGSASTRAVLVTAHYDSVESGPGAGDNGMGVASMLETLRALRAAPPLHNDLIFLFNDGEESGMFGSRAFVQEHPWARDVGVVFDFDAGIPAGVVALQWTTPEDGWLVGEMARSGTGLLDVRAENLDKRREFSNDLHAFAAAGYTGAHFDLIGGSTYYHTQRDNLANLDLRTLQGQGAAILALARHFGSVAIGETGAGDLAALAPFGLPVLSYPVAWTFPLALVVAVGAAAVVAFGIWRGRLAPLGVAGGALAVAVVAAVAGVVARLAWQAVLAAHPESAIFEERDFYGREWWQWGVYALTLAIALALLPWLAGRLGETNIAAAGVAWVAVLALLLGFVQPAWSFMAAWPALAGALALAYLVWMGDGAAGRGGWVRFGVLVLAALPAAGLLVPGLYLPIMEGAGDGPALQVAVMVLFVGLLSPQLRVVVQVGRRWLPALAGLVGIALLVVGAAASGYDAARPWPDNVLYTLNADTGEAYWATPDRTLDEWTGRLLAGGAPRTLDELLGSGESDTMLSAPAPAVTLPAPTLALRGQDVADGVRTMRLHLASPRQAWRAYLVPGAGVQLLAAGVGDKPPVDLPGGGLQITGLPAEGIDVTVKVRADGPARFTVIDQSIGLPEIPGMPPRPASVMAAPSPERTRGYPTAVHATFTFPAADAARP